MSDCQPAIHPTSIPIQSLTHVVNLRTMDNFTGAQESDEDRGYTLLVVTWVECTISILLVTLRMFSRAKIIRKVGWDDWFMCISLVSNKPTHSLIRIVNRLQLFTIAFSIWVTFYISFGGGRHVYYLTPTQVVPAAKASWIILSLAIVAIVTGKASVALLILRLMGPGIGKWRKRFLYTVSIAGFLFGGIAIAIIWSQCQPPRALWDPPAGRCPVLEETNKFHIFVSSMK